MFLVNVFLAFCCMYLISGYPTDDTYVNKFCSNFTRNIHYGFKELTPEERKRFDEWTEDSKQNIWTLSGQFQDEKDKEFIEQTLRRFQNRTCIEFIPVTAIHRHYILVTNRKGGGCVSSVGFQGRIQDINLETKCFKSKGKRREGTILHEFLHALGFYHMQSDPVRDDFVQIFWENILPGKEINFCKLTDTEGSSLGVPYDYDSIMHYGEYAFSIDKELGEPTMYPLNTSANIGQRIGLSQRDVDKINIMYDCPPKNP